MRMYLCKVVVRLGLGLVWSWRHAVSTDLNGYLVSFSTIACRTFPASDVFLPDQQHEVPIGQSALAFGPHMARKSSCLRGV